MSKRRMAFTALLIIVLVGISAAMFVIGRGHSIYFDTAPAEVGGVTYKAPYKTEVYVRGERVAKLYDSERGEAKCIGQTLEMILVTTQEKGGTEENWQCVVELPYNLDGIVINLPAYLAGLGPEDYLSEFIPLATEVEEEEEVPSEEDLTMGGEF